MTYMHHITLNTGHMHKQTRVSEGSIAVMLELLDPILLGGDVPVPADPGVIARGHHAGKSLLVTLISTGHNAPLLTTGIALRSTAAKGLWSLLHRSSSTPLRTNIDDMPAAPWIADRIEDSIGAYPEALAWTGAWAASLGWAWMDYAGADKKEPQR